MMHRLPQEQPAEQFGVSRWKQFSADSAVLKDGILLAKTAGGCEISINSQSVVVNLTSPFGMRSAKA